MVYLKECERRFAVFEIIWRACAILSRSLLNRRPRRRRGPVDASADAWIPGTATKDGSGTVGADGDALPEQATAKQNLLQQQLDGLNQLD